MASSSTSHHHRSSSSSLQPKSIPPRTSSSGSHNHSSSLTQSPPPPAPATTSTADHDSRSILKTVSEGDWLSSRQPPPLAPPSPLSSPNLARMPHAPEPNTTLPGLWSPPYKVSGITATAAPPPPPPPPTGDNDPNRFRDYDLNFGPGRSWSSDNERIVRGPYDYVVSHPGKDFRAQLISAFNAWLDVDPESLSVITRVVGMLHESSLLVDDVQDSSELRRGFPVAHHVFGVAQTINAANYMYFDALRELQALDGTPPSGSGSGSGSAGAGVAVATFAEELANLHRGQGMDLYWRDTLTCPSEDDYLDMVGNKTAGLFRLGVKLMQQRSREPEPRTDCVPLINLIGLIFQIRDDYMNLSSSEYSSNKGLCEDLTEGKFSFPVIHSIRADPANRELINILKQKTSDVQVKRYAVCRMEATGSFQYTRSVLAVLIERARRTAVEIDRGRGKLAGILKILDKMSIE
ncbi:geranylgeranyl diphosphate synthase, type III [Geosmithia morbida]|uniref:Geranylgeranyl diphosphate synthase, type III n=1 Tax=Geosmithia morbida TaxID=1094350 RepID=A0A9P4Z240_9HYPO|nr:geranylgeranyl diphosphate synthase, type III [Geosmithia morbida]KAF4126280.1 geranylgeranyl diphosphate synthase, type III [Geosmithia morbida]